MDVPYGCCSSVLYLMSAVLAGAVACEGTDGDGGPLLHCRKRSGWNASSGHEGGPLQSYSRCQGRPCCAPNLALTLSTIFVLDLVFLLWRRPCASSLAFTLC